MMKKYLRKKHILFFLSLFTFVLPQNIYSQVSKYQSIEKVGRATSNILNIGGKKYNYKKDKSIRLVFSDRDNNTTYLDPYGQKKNISQSFLTSYFVINSQNGFCELVEADDSLIGKPKSIFSFLMNKKYHFSDTKRLKYVGWVSLNNLIPNPESLKSTKNNRPLKYKVGFQIPSLFELHKYFNKDSLIVYKDPFLKKKSDKTFLINQVVYLYKYDLTKKTVFVSDKPIIKDTINQISGWIPADFIQPIGQSEVFRLDNKFSFNYIDTQKKDSISISAKDIFSDFLYNKSSFYSKQIDSLTQISMPIYVWNHIESKLIDVDGKDILVSEIDRLKKESKVINFHFIFDHTERTNIKLLVNSLQSIWVFLSRRPNIELSFSSICTGEQGIILPKTTSFATWLDFIQKVSENDFSDLQQENNLNIVRAIDNTLSHKSYSGKNFESNFFIIVGNWRQSDLSHNRELIKKMANKSSSVLFVQMNNRIDNDSQNYILKAKETMSVLGTIYNSFIRHYIVDNNLVVQNNSLKNIASETDNIYIYDAPINSRFNGGIIFPKINKTLTPLSLNIAIDSILVNIQQNNKQLISSLEYYNSKLSILRAKPTSVLQRIFSGTDLSDSLKISQIDRNNIDEVFYKDFDLENYVVDSLQNGYIFNKDELMSLIEDYRILLPYFSKDISKKERKILKKTYINQVKGINNSFRRKVLSKCKSSIGDLFYYKTGIPFTESILHQIHIKHLKRKNTEEKYHFSEIYFILIKKLNLLEEKFLNNQIEKTSDNRYYIPNDMLL